MRIASLSALSVIFLGVVMQIWPASSGATLASQPSWSGIVAATPTFLQPKAASFIEACKPSPGGTQRLGFGSSVIPPGGPQCSIDDGTICSAFNRNERCSALNDAGHICSTFHNPAQPGAGQCSSIGDRSACTVLPPSQGGNPSQCSIFGDLNLDSTQTCSTVGPGLRQLCSVKGNGQSQCSAVADPGQCSVSNLGAPDRSFCSTKVGRGGAGGNSKLCSVFVVSGPPGNIAQCSIAIGGRGICTNFGFAPAGSCSVHTPPPSHCSIMDGGPAGDRCAQP